MFARRVGWRGDYRWGRVNPWVNGPWSVFSDLVWYFDARYATLDSVVRGKVQTKGAFSRAGTPYYWDEGIIKAVAANIPRFEENYGSVKALLLEPAATNKCIQSQNFGAWTASGTPTEAQDQVGIDGAPNTAWTIGDDSAVAIESELFDVTVPNDSNYTCASIFVKKDSTTTRFPEFLVSYLGGSGGLVTAFQINTATGGSTTRATVGTAINGVDSYGNFWRVRCALLNNNGGNTTFRLSIIPARGLTLGGNDVSAVGSIIVDAAQIELNTKVPTSFIPTAGSEASRTTEASGLTWTLPAGIFTGTKVFTAVVIGKLGAAEANFAANHNILATSAAANSLMYVDNSGDFAITDATSAVSKDVNLVRGTRYKVATKADGTPEINVGAVAAASAWTSAAWGTATAYDGDMAVGASMLLGQTLGFPMWVEKVWIFNRVLSDAEINMLR